MRFRTRRVLRVILAPALVALGTAAAIWADPSFVARSPFLFFFPAVIISAWFGGWVHGAVAAILSALAVSYYFPPFLAASAFQRADVLRLSLFLAESAVFTFLIHLVQNARDEAEAKNAEVRQGLDLISNLVDTVPSAIVATDEQGAVFLFNRAAEALTGYSRDEVFGKPLLDLFVPEEWRETVRLRFDPARHEEIRKPHRNPWVVKDGGERMIEWRCAALQTAAGIRILGVGHDVTELMLLEQSRDEAAREERAARLQAEEASRSKDLFLATVSHELRSPLTSILGWVSLIQSSADEELRVRGLSAIEGSARAQARLVEDLLDLSRAYAGKLELHSEPVDVRPLVASTVDLVLPEAQRKRLDIRTRIEQQDALVVNGDRDRLRQVLLNVLQNALRYTDDGGIEVAVARKSGFIELVVTDTGRGIDPEFLPKIFEPFTREMAQGKPDSQEGLGIGLAVVKRLVDLHGGEVVATSAGAGQGSSFHVRLPVAV